MWKSLPEDWTGTTPQSSAKIDPDFRFPLIVFVPHRMHNPSMEGSRFQVGDIVHITDIASPYYSEEGRILAILVDRRAHSPDKYDVVFADGRSATFWDAQLKMKLVH